MITVGAPNRRNLMIQYIADVNSLMLSEKEIQYRIHENIIDGVEDMFILLQADFKIANTFTVHIILSEKDDIKVVKYLHSELEKYFNSKNVKFLQYVLHVDPSDMVYDRYLLDNMGSMILDRSREFYIYRESNPEDAPYDKYTLSRNGLYIKQVDRNVSAPSIYCSQGYRLTF